MVIGTQSLFHLKSVGLTKATGNDICTQLCPNLWILQRKLVPHSYFPLMCLLGLPILGFKALSRTPAVIALVVLLLSVVVLVAITVIQFHHKEVLLPGLKVSVRGLALKG